MITKAKLKEQIDSLPEQFSIDDLVERLILNEEKEINNQKITKSYLKANLIKHKINANTI